MMIVNVVIGTVLCLGLVRGSPVACPEGPDSNEDCALNMGDGSRRCATGGCGVYSGQCPDSHTLLAHPTDCKKYCQCDADGAICERSVPAGTRFNGGTQGFVIDDGCPGGVCGSNPCRNSGTCSAGGSTPLPWSCSCVQGCSGWNCQYGQPAAPCAANPCPPGVLCENKVSQWWPQYIPYTCTQLPNPCNPNPCLEGGTCTPNPNNDYGYDCQCMVGCYGQNCDCAGVDPCTLPANANVCGSNGDCYSPKRNDRGEPVCGTLGCKCKEGWSGALCTERASNNAVIVDNEVCAATCAGGANVNRPFPDACNRYCACGHGTKHIMTCPAGTFFDPDKCFCDFGTCQTIA